MKDESFNSIIEMTELEGAQNEHLFELHILKDSPIFEGHFPQTPVLPGVVMVAAVKKALSRITKNPVSLKSSSTLKFLAVITPLEVTHVKLKLNHQTEGTQIKVDASIFDNDRVYFKMKAIYEGD